MPLDTDFRAKVLSLITAPVQQNYISTDKVQPRVWYQKQAGNSDLFADASAGMVETTYTVEVNGTDPDAVSEIADAISTAFNGFRGRMFSTTVLGAFVEDAADDYQYKGQDLDEGYHVFAMNVRFIT